MNLIILALLILFELTVTESTHSKSSTYHNHYSKDYVDIPETSVVFNELGVILQEEKFMGLDSNNVMISLFVKSNFSRFNPVAFSECLNNDLGKKAMDLINSTVLEYEQLFYELLNVEYSMSHNNSRSRNKRSILGFFNLGLNLFTSAISGLNQYRIGKQVSKLKEQFEDFVQSQERINARNIRIHKLFVKIIHNVELKMVKMLKDIQCKMDSNILKVASQLVANEYLSHLKELLSPLQSGVLTGRLSHNILPLPSLAQLIKEHPSLNGTIYTDLSPTLLYRASEIMVAEVRTTNSALVVHYILTVPFLTYKNTFKSYTLRQVGFMMSPGSCAWFDLPTKVVLSNGIYYSLENTMCSAGPLDLCYSQPVHHLPEVQCLTNTSTCTLLADSCPPFQYIFDKTGILLRHEHKIMALLRGSTIVPAIHEISPANNGVTFLPWHKYSLIQIADQNIRSPTFISTFIEEARCSEFNFSLLANYSITNMSKIVDIIDQSDVSPTVNTNQFSWLFPAILSTAMGTAFSVLISVLIMSYRNRFSCVNCMARITNCCLNVEEIADTESENTSEITHSPTEPVVILTSRE